MSKIGFLNNWKYWVCERYYSEFVLVLFGVKLIDMVWGPYLCYIYLFNFGIYWDREEPMGGIDGK